VSPEANLLFAIFKQCITDYIKLDPQSDTCSADFFESEEEDFKTAEDFIYNGAYIYYGELIFTFEDLVEQFSPIIRLTPKQLRKKISEQSIEY
jgi:hypothetical protein